MPRQLPKRKQQLPKPKARQWLMSATDMIVNTYFDWSDNEESAASRSKCENLRRNKCHVRKDETVKTKKNAERVMIDVGKDTRGPPKV